MMKREESSVGYLWSSTGVVCVLRIQWKEGRRGDDEDVSVRS